MTKHLLAIFCLLPLAFGLGCEDSTNQNQPDDADADTDADSDSDSDADSDAEYMIVATIPFEGVSVYVSDDSGAIVKDAAVCAGTTCTYQVPETGRYDVEAEDTFTFVPHKVFVDKPGEFQVSWIEGGCASDPDWAADDPCDEWVPGEYGFAPLEGSYTDEIWGAELELTIFLDENEGQVVLEGISDGATMGGGDTFYVFISSTESYSAGVVIEEQTISMHSRSASGSEADFLFHRD